MNSQSDEIPKLILSRLKNKRDKISNATRHIVASGTPLTTQRIRNLQTSPLLIKAVAEQSIENIYLFMQKSSKGVTILTQF